MMGKYHLIFTVQTKIEYFIRCYSVEVPENKVSCENLLEYENSFTNQSRCFITQVLKTIHVIFTVKDLGKKQIYESYGNTSTRSTSWLQFMWG